MLKAMPVANNTKLILLIHAALLAFLDPSSDQNLQPLSVRAGIAGRE
jgi:hypothetical protein